VYQSFSVQNECCRQLLELKFKCRQREDGCFSDDSNSEHEGEKSCVEHWEKKLNEEESNSEFLTAISTLMEDAPEIAVVLFVIASGNLPEMLG